MGLVPKRLIPIFRDRSDLDVPHLGPRIEQALRDSAALVVLCSPSSVQSTWVGREVITFKLLGKGDRIFPVVALSSAAR
jgi:eukaryotic-like serine/threonine-protein kinase